MVLEAGLWLLRVHSSPCYEWKPMKREPPWEKAQLISAVAQYSAQCGPSIGTQDVFH